MHEREQPDTFISWEADEQVRTIGGGVGGVKGNMREPHTYWTQRRGACHGGWRVYENEPSKGRNGSPRCFIT